MLHTAVTITGTLEFGVDPLVYAYYKNTELRAMSFPILARARSPQPPSKVPGEAPLHHSSPSAVHCETSLLDCTNTLTASAPVPFSVVTLKTTSLRSASNTGHTGRAAPSASGPRQACDGRPPPSFGSPLQAKFVQ